MSWKKEDWYIAGAALLILACIAAFAYRTQTLGRDSSDYETRCIRGHEYYQASFGAKGYLAIAIDDVGAPVECDGGCEDYKKYLEKNKIGSSSDGLEILQ